MKVAFRELEDAAIPVAPLPYLEHVERKNPRQFLVISVSHDPFACIAEFCFDVPVIGNLTVFVQGLPQYHPLPAAKLHKRISAERHLLRTELVQGDLVPADGHEHIPAAGADGGHLFQVSGNAGVDIEIQKDRLSSPGKGVLGTVKDQLLGALIYLLFRKALQERRIHDVDIGHAQGAGVICLH